MRIAIIAPALALRTGLHALVDTSPLEVIYQADSLAGFGKVAGSVDVLLITADSLSLPALQQELPKEDGRLGILVISSYVGDVPGLRALPLRAWGALPLEATAEELHAALVAVGQGLLVGTAPLLEAALSGRDLTGFEKPVRSSLSISLTERESEVLQWLARGLSNKQIATTLNLSEHTVKFHISSIYAKLGVASRTEAVHVGIQRGLVLL